MKIIFIKEEKELLLNYIGEFINLKPILSNYFPSDSNDYEYFKTKKSIILRKRYPTFHRIYFMTLDIKEIELILVNLKGRNAINIPSKGEISDLKTLMTSCGYDLIGVYERFFNPKTESKKGFMASYAGPDHFSVIKSMMYANFNAITDWLPDDDILKTMICNKQVIINMKNNEILGFLVFTFIGKKCYLNCWYDTCGEGLSLLFNVYSLMKNNNISYSYFWVNSMNTNVKKIHTLLGSKPDGLKDYTFFRENN